MAAAGAAAKNAPWIARMWRMGWEKIPVVMVAHCVTTPLAILFVGYHCIFGAPEQPVEKYRHKFTVVRPGDPRIAKINNESRWDRIGFFS